MLNVFGDNVDELKVTGRDVEGIIRYYFVETEVMSAPGGGVPREARTLGHSFYR